MSLKSSIASTLTRIYRTLFARRCCWELNLFLYDLALRGMGILNYENRGVSGEKRFLQDYLRPKNHSIVVDVGANIGEYAKMVIEIQPTATVYAIEPHPVTFVKLQQNADANKFRAFNFACDAHGGQITLYDYAENDGSEHASVFKEAIMEFYHKEPVAHVVTLMTLDDFMIQNTIEKIDLLKIDVEGNELNVLKGCTRAIGEGKINVIHFEFNEMNILSRTYFKDFITALPEYVFFRMLPSGLKPMREYRPLTHEIFAFQNIVAMRHAMMDEKFRELIT